MANLEVNNFVLGLSTVNGSGSQTANLMLVKTLFRMGIPVGGKNLFPSNIQGLPTWFTIRAHPQGFIARRPLQDVVVSLNPTTAHLDQKNLRPQGLFLHSTDCRLKPEQIRHDIHAVAVAFREIVSPISDSVKNRKFLTNMIYVGILAELLPLDENILNQVILDQFKNKSQLMLANQAAVQAGRDWAQKHLSNFIGTETPLVRAQTIANGNQDHVLIDGNTAAAMGLVDGGCTFASWYPITPSSSLMEEFIHYSHLWRQEKDGKLKVAIVQAEDELSAIGMVLGAGWAGARSVTATSGPGMSLMSEAAGLSYFAEIPAVIWNVQRAGPSTGLPTRTMQGDVRAAANLSHGDTKHVLLFPANPQECFEFARVALDLSGLLQTLVIVLSDLDLGMNLHSTPKWSPNPAPLQRGKVLGVQELENVKTFARYADTDGDGISARTLPGTNHPLAAYFTRGTGHDETSRYSEDSEVFQQTLQKLNRKWETAKTLVPRPAVEMVKGASIGLIAYGSSDLAIPELRSSLEKQNKLTHYLRLKSYPFTTEVENFLNECSQVYVIEQNRDGQMRELLACQFPKFAPRLKSVVRFDGWPLAPEDILPEVQV